MDVYDEVDRRETEASEYFLIIYLEENEIKYFRYN